MNLEHLSHFGDAGLDQTGRESRFSVSIPALANCGTEIVKHTHRIPFLANYFTSISLLLWIIICVKMGFNEYRKKKNELNLINVTISTTSGFSDRTSGLMYFDGTLSFKYRA